MTAHASCLFHFNKSMATVVAAALGEVKSHEFFLLISSMSNNGERVFISIRKRQITD